MTTTDRATVTVTETLHVGRAPDVVFDYTQDYATRADWDRSVTEANVLSESPRRVRLAVRGLGRFTVEYRLFRRPERTSAAFVDVASPWLAGGGGSWRYEPRDGGTDWTQTNTLELQRSWFIRLIAPIVKRNLRSGMRRAMAAAKATIEAS